MRSNLLTIVLIALGAAVGQGQIIDHADVDGVTALSQATLDAIGQETWLFTHASVGGNMIDGMNSLHDADPTRYQLVTTSTGDDGSQADAPPASTTAGTIYDCSRGNPGWEEKIAFFDRSVRTSGWRAPAITAALDKMCYIDQDADATTYLNSMAALEAAYPDTVFVYATMPLTTSSDADNIARNEYNAAVRSYCSANAKLLFDIADIEAHDPAGTQYAFSTGGQTYQRMYSGYSSDGGHLNSAGAERIASGWYAVAASIAGASTEGSTGDSSTTTITTTTRSGLCGFGSAGPVAVLLLGLVGRRAMPRLPVSRRRSTIRPRLKTAPGKGPGSTGWRTTGG